MSGPSSSNFSSSDVATAVAAVRELSGLPAGQGPTDEHIAQAIANFVGAFERWYVKVMREAVPQYRNLIIKRINPFIRPIDCGGLGPGATAARLVDDYNSRNFVTAGGWALEGLAIGISQFGRKSSAVGIDLEREDAGTRTHHLYVLKSGLVTRNSDILSALKKNARAAEKLLRQNGAAVSVTANYAVLAGATSTTFEDGIRRPASAEFWSEMTGLPAAEAVKLVLAVATISGRYIRRDATEHLEALKLLVADYIAKRDNDEVVDWEFIAQRNMQPDVAWKGDDRARHARALERLAKTGYSLEGTAPRRPKAAAKPQTAPKRQAAPKRRPR
jgi:hypothetical protein